jgi:MFS family permease
MTDAAIEKGVPDQEIASPKNPERSYSQEEAGSFTPPTSWKYRSVHIAGFRIPWYASPPIQLLIVAFVCFLCPGMFNALNGMGGGGNFDHTASDDANTSVYATFAVVGFFAGTFTNKLGVKFALSFGGLGYSVYVAAFLCYKHTTNLGFVIFAGSLLGLCAGLLWTAQGTIMMSYPPEESKGKYISWFWMIFNLGAVIGSLVSIEARFGHRNISHLLQIPLGQNIHVMEHRTVTDGTYIGFLILTIIGAALSFTLVNAKDVLRSDGSKVILMKNPTWWTEISGLGQTFKTDPYIVLMFPMFFASNWFYTYQFNDYNGIKFNTRTAALNNVLYYIMQIVGAFIAGYALDRQSIRRSLRARICWVVLFVLTMVIWGGGLKFQNYTRPSKEEAPFFPTMDWTSHGYVGPMVSDLGLIK